MIGRLAPTKKKRRFSSSCLGDSTDLTPHLFLKLKLIKYKKINLIIRLNIFLLYVSYIIHGYAQESIGFLNGLKVR
jgi:hypothetical protein